MGTECCSNHLSERSMLRDMAVSGGDACRGDFDKTYLHVKIIQNITAFL